VDNQTIFILEGIFLFRKELENYWDFKIFLDVSFETALNRNIQREKDQQSIGDKEQIINRYNMRYIPGQKMYFKNDNPRETSDIILDNNDYNKPILLKCNMNLKYTLEQAKESDKVFLLELRKTTMLSYLEKAGIILSEEEHIERVESFFDSSYIIENEDENSIGLLKYVEDKKSIELVQLQILPEYQSKGIGSTILKDLIAKSQKLDKQLTLKVLKNNPSKILYLRM
jgi:N-acetylglutamate synthase-like GNAT family acetyltransferase